MPLSLLLHLARRKRKVKLSAVHYGTHNFLQSVLVVYILPNVAGHMDILMHTENVQMAHMALC